MAHHAQDDTPGNFRASRHRSRRRSASQEVVERCPTLIRIVQIRHGGSGDQGDRGEDGDVGGADSFRKNPFQSLEIGFPLLGFSPATITDPPRVVWISSPSGRRELSARPSDMIEREGVLPYVCSVPSSPDYSLRQPAGNTAHGKRQNSSRGEFERFQKERCRDVARSP